MSFGVQPSSFLSGYEEEALSGLFVVYLSSQQEKEMKQQMNQQMKKEMEKERRGRKRYSGKKQQNSSRRRRRKAWNEKVPSLLIQTPPCFPRNALDSHMECVTCIIITIVSQKVEKYKRAKNMRNALTEKGWSQERRKVFLYVLYWRKEIGWRPSLISSLITRNRQRPFLSFSFLFLCHGRQRDA